ncbi:hypothetical protein O6P43_035560 [Quillaja saponaria]|uniref:Uncharacterized protein n=1 Tax=Quillaja saponaria TaxID=32244 RepID=A0AAD7KL11_QUISA|nr:hypothetical protein O6P43_035560 [Quillaja saponaria]
MDGSWKSVALLGFPHLGSLGKRIKLALANSLMHLSPFNPLSEMRQKEIKSMDRPPRLHHRRNYENHPQDAFGIQGSRTDHRNLFNKWKRISCPLSGWTVRVGEGQSLILKTSLLRPKSRAERGGTVLRSRFSTVAGSSGTTRILS